MEAAEPSGVNWDQCGPHEAPTLWDLRLGPRDDLSVECASGVRVLRRTMVDRCRAGRGPGP